MNRLTYNLIFWPCFIFGAKFAHATVNSLLLALCIVCFVVSGIRIKTLGRSLWNLLWLCIPVACCIYALFIGISNKRV